MMTPLSRQAMQILADLPDIHWLRKICIPVPPGRRQAYFRCNHHGRAGLSGIQRQMKLYCKMTMKELLLTLSKLRRQEIKGAKILFPLTRLQMTIFKAFGVKEPV
ncbi:hypothetical protein LZ24_03451 [Desulfobotulus alkaliphilus]|uniref:Uncharacterized protein n=1 Tax=Desulfobotulus alkaliphilus TaxID=622671 RepID=A0A562QWX4_9BACT|nr:hypothetical protein LZ24_03451 [Desulfobotulus alkaliphilus]